MTHRAPIEEDSDGSGCVLEEAWLHASALSLRAQSRSLSITALPWLLSLKHFAPQWARSKDATGTRGSWPYYQEQETRGSWHTIAIGPRVSPPRPLWSMGGEKKRDTGGQNVH